MTPRFHKSYFEDTGGEGPESSGGEHGGGGGVVGGVGGKQEERKEEMWAGWVWMFYLDVFGRFFSVLFVVVFNLTEVVFFFLFCFFGLCECWC